MEEFEATFGELLDLDERLVAHPLPPLPEDEDAGEAPPDLSGGV